MSNMKKAFDLQLYQATKQLFKAVAEGKSVLVYGPPGSGKSTLMGDNELLLQKYEYIYVDLQCRQQLENVLKRKDLFVANGHYTGMRKLYLPRDDVQEIFLPMSLGECTNELQYNNKMT